MRNVEAATTLSPSQLMSYPFCVAKRAAPAKKVAKKAAPKKVAKKAAPKKVAKKAAKKTAKKSGKK